MTPQEEERQARARLRRLAKARRVRQAKASSTVWAKVREHRRATGCTCDLRPGMSWSELLDLGAGCTADRHWVCSTLDLYRSLVRRPAGKEKARAA